MQYALCSKGKSKSVYLKHYSGTSGSARACARAARALTPTHGGAGGSCRAEAARPRVCCMFVFGLVQYWYVVVSFIHSLHCRTYCSLIACVCLRVSLCAVLLRAMMLRAVHVGACRVVTCRVIACRAVVCCVIACRVVACHVVTCCDVACRDIIMVTAVPVCVCEVATVWCTHDGHGACTSTGMVGGRSACASVHVTGPPGWCHCAWQCGPCGGHVRRGDACTVTAAVCMTVRVWRCVCVCMNVRMAVPVQTEGRHSSSESSSSTPPRCIPLSWLT